MKRPSHLLDRGFWSRMRHSLRTRYSLATGFFLIFILAVFYVGGRIVFVTLGIADPADLPADVGLPKNAVMGREYVEGRKLEPGDREGGVANLMAFDLRPLEEQRRDDNLKPGSVTITPVTKQMPVAVPPPAPVAAPAPQAAPAPAEAPVEAKPDPATPLEKL